MKKRVLNIIVVIITIGIIYEAYSYFNMKPNNKVLENIKIVDKFDKNDKSLSIMIQNDGISDGETEYGWHEAEDKSKWPDLTKYSYAGTECTDASGAKVDNPRQYLQFDEVNKEATITTKKTIYCTLYFGKGRPALETLDAQGGAYYAGGQTGDSKVAVEGLYRFKGTYEEVTNNFICIGGPKNPETCGSAENNKYLYRIIGVTDGTESDESNSLGLDKGMLKVIKVIPSSTSQAWASYDIISYFTWDYKDSTESLGAVARWTLNNTFYNGLGGVKGLIKDVYWWKGDKTSETYASESKTRTSEKYPVGLMYKSDYYNSWTYKGYPSYTNSWLHIIYTMSGKTGTYGSTYEWTMTRGSANNTGAYEAWYLDYRGDLARRSVEMKYAIRPVFYLKPDVSIIGTGTESSPYIITTLTDN